MLKVYLPLLIASALSAQTILPLPDPAGGISTAANIYTTDLNFTALASQTGPFSWNVAQPPFNAKPYPADSSAAFAAASAACIASPNGGIVVVPPGTWMFQQFVRGSSCIVKGAGSTGMQITKVLQSPNANEDFLVSQGVGYGGTIRTETWAAGNSGSASPTIGGGYEGILVDGNAINQSGSGPYYGVREYAVGYHNRDLRVTDTKGPCAAWDYNNAMAFDTSGSWNTTGDTVTTDHCGTDLNNPAFPVLYANAHGVELGGPADMVYTNFTSFDNTGDDVFLGHNIGDLYITGHCYSPTLACIWNEAYGVKGFIEIEGAHIGQVNLALLNSKNLLQLDIFRATPSSTAPGIQFGQASGGTPHCNSFFQTVPGACSGGTTTAASTLGNNLQITSQGFLSEDLLFTGFDADNIITITSDHTSATGGVLYSGTPDATDNIIATVIGLTCNDTFQKCGGAKLGNFRQLQGNTTTVNGSVSGTITCTMALNGVNLKTAVCASNSLSGTASYTFPSAFVNTPGSVIGGSGISVSAISTTATTITGTGTSGSVTFSGN